MAENNLGNTQYFRTKPDQELQVKEVLDLVYNAMDEKGYNPVNQIVGYIMSGDPTYITSHKGARSMIMKVERDELVEELLTEYIKNKSWERPRAWKRYGASRRTSFAVHWHVLKKLFRSIRLRRSFWDTRKT